MSKPSEAVYVASLLDDAAALGKVDRLRALSKRWNKHANRPSASAKQYPAPGWTPDEWGWWRGLFRLASRAAAYRASAVEHRLRGLCDTAAQEERFSDQLLRDMARMARRIA